MSLLAQAEAAGFPQLDIADIVMRQGPLVLVFLVVIGFVVWYGRRFAEGHIELVGTLKDNAIKSDGYQARQTLALEKLTETQKDLVEQSKRFICKHP